MFRRFMTSLILLLVLPAFAHAWYVNAKTSPTIGQGTISPSGTKYYATGVGSDAYTVAPAAGYKVTRVTLDGVPVGTTTGPYTVAYNGKSYRYLVAYFTANTVNITTSITGSGGIREDDGESLTNIPVGSTRTLLIAPAAGYQIDTYSAANASSDSLDPITGVRTVTYTNLQANQMVEATFKAALTATAYAGSDQSTTGTGIANAATLSGSGSVSTGTATYAWSGPAELVFTAYSSASTQVWSDIPGVYTATLTVSNVEGALATDEVQVTVASNIAYESSLCTSCHENGKDSSAVGICNLDGTGRSPHLAGQALVKAQYVSETSKPIVCSDCHDQTHDNAIEVQFAKSAHGDVTGGAWMHYDWRSSSRASCARCHAGTAFVAKLGNENDTANAYLPGDITKPGEALSCSSCHTDAGTGALRLAPRAFTINLTNAATVTYDVPGASTLCARCHGGRETGESIMADPSATGVRGFIDSHYLAAAGTLYNMAGYEYAGQSYDSLGSHKQIGAGVSGTGNQGPCVACHMGVNSSDHTWEVVSRNTDGSLAAIASNVCANCHDALLPSALEKSKQDYVVALKALRAALEAKGIYFSPAHPYFYTAPYVARGSNTAFTDWASVYGVAKWKDVMGAAFNYNLLEHEPGAFAHNPGYSMKLIVDSIDFLNDGLVNGNGSVN